jgi:hypothetical protein
MKRTFSIFAAGAASALGLLAILGAGGPVKSPTGTAPDLLEHFGLDVPAYMNRPGAVTFAQ